MEMKLFLITLLILITAVAGMAVGAIFKNRPLQGSCGGLKNLFGLKCLFCARRDCKNDSQKDHLEG